MTIMEFYCLLWKSQGESAAKEILVHVKNLPVTIVESSERLALSAGRIKALHAMSVADAFIAATAIQMHAILVRKDPEYEPARSIVEQCILPYK